MPAAALPANEMSRQALLEALGILDTAPEDDYDDIVRIAATVCRAPMATISLVDAERQWFKARLGLDFDETPRDIAFCAHAILDADPLLVDDATADPRFADNPMVANDGVRFYAGAPVEAGGMPIGTVCVLDREPRSLTSEQVQVLQALARQVGRLIELRRASRLLQLHLREREWYAEQLARHETLLQAQAPQASRPGLIDLVTQLPGPAAFAGLVDDELAATGDTPLMVARIEIDDLGMLEDVHGPEGAAQLLRALASLLRTGEVAEGRLARAGTGFALLMHQPEAQAVAQCMRLSELAGNPASGVPVTLSIGLAAHEAGDTGADLLERAEHALAQARGAGGARVEAR